MPARRTRENKQVEEEYGRKSSSRTVKLEEPEDDHDEGGETQPFRQDFYNSVYRTVRLIPEGKVSLTSTFPLFLRNSETDHLLIAHRSHRMERLGNSLDTLDTREW